MKNKKYLPVFALYEEAQELSRKSQKTRNFFNKSQHPLVTGIGKVNAAMKLGAEMISMREDELGQTVADTIVNLGTAGSSDFEPGTIVQCMSFYQRDMQLPGYLQGFTPFEESKTIDYIVRHKVPKKTKYIAMCSTGDSFVSDMMAGNMMPDQKRNKVVFDMEAFALAKVCAIYSKKFECYKYITDSGDFEDWAQTLNKASKALSKFYIENFIKGNE